MTSLSLRIAIADDDRSTLEVLQMLLGKLGHEVIVIADNGRSLIDECAVMEPDVIITDNLMPGISGAAAAAIIYERRPVPIILLSAFCDPELVIDAERKHVLMYMVKPLSEAHIEVALNRCRKERNGLRAMRTKIVIRGVQGDDGLATGAMFSIFRIGLRERWHGCEPPSLSDPKRYVPSWLSGIGRTAARGQVI
jgi:DNA-binding NarL/FixJ family response regulator